MVSVPVKLVADVIRKAKKNGRANEKSYAAFYYPESDELVLEHYGTKIYQDRGGELVRLGGYSASDRDAINTALFGLEATSSR